MPCAKFLVALAGAAVSAGLQFLRNRYNIDLLGFETDITVGISGGLTALLVWAVPNKAA